MSNCLFTQYKLAHAHKDLLHALGHHLRRDCVLCVSSLHFFCIRKSSMLSDGKLTISGFCGQETERDVLELAIYPYAYFKLRKFYPMSPGDQRPELSVSLVVTT